MRALALISGRGSNLQAIVQAMSRGELTLDLAAVVSNRADAPGLEYARAAGIPTQVVADAPRADFQARLRTALDAWTVDCVILAGFMRVLAADTVTAYRGKMVNIHPSLLPKYKGLHTHARALAAGDAEHGASVHFVTPDLDDGPVIAQTKIPVLPDDTPEGLAARLLPHEHQLYPQVLAWLAAGRLQWRADGVYFDGNVLRQPLIYPASTSSW